VLALRLRDPLPRHEASPPPPERGPPQRVQCRYLDAGRPDPAAPSGAVPSRPSVAATWACALPDGIIDAARWTFDLNRPDTWPARLRAEAGPPGAASALDPVLDIGLTSRLADAMVTRPASAPQIVVPLRVAGASTLLLRTWGAREPRSTPPFWLEVWSRAR
jgi:hypothetical protein